MQTTKLGLGRHHPLDTNGIHGGETVWGETKGETLVWVAANLWATDTAGKVSVQPTQVGHHASCSSYTLSVHSSPPHACGSTGEL